MEKKKKMTLKQVRIFNGWSQEDASKLYDVSVDTISNYENYKTYPDVPIIENILKATGLRYDDIIFLPINYGETVKQIDKKMQPN